MSVRWWEVMGTKIKQDGGYRVSGGPEEPPCWGLGNLSKSLKGRAEHSS